MRLIHLRNRALSFAAMLCLPFFAVPCPDVLDIIIAACYTVFNLYTSETERSSMNKRNAQTLDPKHLLALAAAGVLFLICCWNDSVEVGYGVLAPLSLVNVGIFRNVESFPLLLGLFAILACGCSVLRMKTGALIFSVLHLVFSLLTCLRVFSQYSTLWILPLDLLYVAAAVMLLVFTLTNKHRRTFSSICLLLGIFSLLLTFVFTLFRTPVVFFHNSSPRFVGLKAWTLAFRSSGRPIPLFDSFSTLNALWPLSKSISLFILSMGFAFSNPSVSHHNKRKAEKNMADSHYRADTSELYSASLGKLIVLSILTLGIYGLVWQYRLTRSVCSMSDERESATTEFLLCLLIPFYSLYWYYKRGKSFAEAAQDKGYAAEDRGLLYLLAALFGFGSINMCLMQDDVNRIVNGTMRRHAPAGAAHAQQRNANAYHGQAQQQPYAEAAYRQPVYEQPRQEPAYAEPEYRQPAYQPAYQQPQPTAAEATQFAEAAPEQAPRRRRRAAVSAEKLEKLQQLQALLDAGTINADEFSQLKADILSDD